ncbi:uncharacterized protein BDR25DRAFT_348616 [Lindgomyces ingoldianus]|uniref:Uncharacterized protein n=1 Tax=Lindgomyces ingoldianus TaxID=673940 RepID=A0ACB6RIL6_9PLEO|nr:uncharacterized protein BDR25DRAFT_348616 [Lindgomyces ingoldianus]KAF2478362.1 hypothetical protein BDR25DRAFT_348616 [Lindgomyces ingoldianus]
MGVKDAVNCSRNDTNLISERLNPPFIYLEGTYHECDTASINNETHHLDIEIIILPIPLTFTSPKVFEKRRKSSQKNSRPLTDSFHIKALSFQSSDSIFPNSKTFLPISPRLFKPKLLHYAQGPRHLSQHLSNIISIPSIQAKRERIPIDTNMDPSPQCGLVFPNIICCVPVRATRIRQLLRPEKLPMYTGNSGDCEAGRMIQTL